jgi:hypothetical protein
MKRIFAPLLLVALLVLSGCSSVIRAEAIEGLVEDVAARHDALLDGTLDPKTISAADKATFKRSTMILRTVVKEAKK